ncbi:unnamed protein product [Didymodactylos carnosus]|uniref:Protein cereblon n=1 Tax=Didymodactylos carnosus TaxID=1234261 RepID=A0A814NN82_9BILA|nr:unnamed protein product [Didymodactylos carnosus]CAF1150804.1 unnamed protein product [Didymodactylos carnosus]CAF3859113.1 unnamed protein product [Didymodactylos carnosus]CAF3957437.1 unnamed protein product [Didymodactylos carnosus]
MTSENSEQTASPSTTTADSDDYQSVSSELSQSNQQLSVPTNVTSLISNNSNSQPLNDESQENVVNNEQNIDLEERHRQRFPEIPPLGFRSSNGVEFDVFIPFHQLNQNEEQTSNERQENPHDIAMHMYNDNDNNNNDDEHEEYFHRLPEQIQYIQNLLIDQENQQEADDQFANEEDNEHDGMFFDQADLHDNEVERNSDATDDDNGESDEETMSQNPLDDIKQMTYDRVLPTAHSYLGNEFQEFSGMQLLDEHSNRIILPIIFLPNMVLIPNQIVPWQVFSQKNIRLIKCAKDENRLFGVVDACSKRSPESNRDQYGTTAEIVSYYEESHSESNITTLQLKIIGRQRFIIQNPDQHIKRDLYGIEHAQVKILPEINLDRPYLMTFKSICKTYFHIMNYCRNYDITIQNQKFNEQREEHKQDEKEEITTSTCGQFVQQAMHLLTKRRRTSSSTSTSTSSNVNNNHAISSVEVDTDPTVSDPKRCLKRPCSLSPQEQRAKLYKFRTRYGLCSMTPYPYWIYRQYDPYYIMSLIKLEINNIQNTKHIESMPVQPGAFSDWLLMNLPFELHTVQNILALPTCVQRLQFVLSWLKKYKKFLCRRCFADICENEDIFSMSVQGLMSAYVNPHGQIHETLTVYKGKNLKVIGPRTLEHSWFPGYSWQIVQCQRCGNHLGWKFTASNSSLKPKMFYGLTRNGLIFARTDESHPPINHDDDDGEDSQHNDLWNMLE